MAFGMKEFRFFFHSNENNEPAQVHVRKSSAEGKVWLVPDLAIAYLHGFTASEEREIWEIAKSHHLSLKQKRCEHFGKQISFYKKPESPRGVRIEAVNFHRQPDLRLVVLNTKSILRQKISIFSRLKNATDDQLQQYVLIGNGAGIHWPTLDEDLSIKGFWRDELRNLIGGPKNSLAA